MRFRFLHCADAHLGYRQYGSSERNDDFTRAFLHVMDEAVRLRVDFVLLAGDLFHKRAIDALTLNVAFRGLEKLKQAGIPCIAIEGNHELAYYDESVGWLHFLALRELLAMLRPEIKDGKVTLAAYTNRKGSYLDVLPGVRVHGLRYMGAGASGAIEKYADALAALPDEGVEFNIFMAHTGVEGILSGDVGSPSLSKWTVLRPYIDYVALGHIHKPFGYDWIWNPGSLESNSVDESEWEDRGYLLVDVDTSKPRGEQYSVERVATPRRPIVRLHVKVDTLASQGELCDHCCEVAARRVGDMGGARYGKHGPVVDLLLSGVLGFDSQDLRVNEVEERVTTAAGALHVLVRNSTLTGTTPVDPTLSRGDLERQIFSQAFETDKKYRDRAGDWANAAIALKTRALEGAAPAALLDELARLIEQVNAAQPAQPAAHAPSPVPDVGTA